MGGAERCFLIISLIMITIFLYHKLSLLNLRYLHDDKNLQQSLKRVYSQLRALRKNHSRLILRLKMIPGLINASTFRLYYLPDVLLEEQRSPTEEYENLRRRIYLNTKELWYYVNYQFRRTFNETLKPALRQSILKEVAERKRWLLSDQERQPSLDGHEEWRRREAASVSDLIQRRLHYLQNPPDCRAAKKLACKQDTCGFGCNIHHVVYCLANAYALERTMILGYFDMDNPLNDWTNAFHPLSETCTESYQLNLTSVSVKEHNNDTEIYLPFSRYYYHSPVRPYFIPKDLAQRISRFNGDPYSWWVGQLVKYVLKLQEPNVINDTVAKMNFTSPIVGVHVRRSDKLVLEAKYLDIDEYMSHVDDYYAQLELTRVVDQRRVYLATDDVDVLKEAIAKYPQYTFYGDYYKAKKAAIETRYSPQGLSNFLLDLHMLALCDYVVCTFSSNMGRMAYELKQTRRTDAINRFISLDEMYYFTINELHNRIAVKRSKDTSFDIGDIIEYSTRFKGITINGTVLKTKANVQFPLYKTEEYIIQHPYPEYNMVPLFSDSSQNSSL